MSQFEEKVKQVLNAFLLPQYRTQNDCDLNNLLWYFEGKKDKELGQQLLQLPFVVQWVPSALIHWQSCYQTPTQSVSSFTLNLTALLSQDEHIFLSYSSDNVYSRLFQLFKVRSKDLLVPPSMKLAFVKIIKSFLGHASGVEWVTSNDVWKECLNFCLSNETIYICAEGQKFVYELLSKCADNNADFVKIVVNGILQGLHQNFCSNGLVDDENMVRMLMPTIKLIHYVLSQLHDSESYKNGNYLVASVFVKECNLEVALNKCLLLSKNKELSFELGRALYYIYMFELALDAKGERFTWDEIEVARKKVCDLLVAWIDAVEISNAVKLLGVAGRLFKAVQYRFPASMRLSKEKAHMRLDMQFFIIQLMPFFAVSFLHCKITYRDIDDDFCRDMLFSKTTKLMSQSIIRICYKFRPVLLAQVDPFQVACQAAASLLRDLRIYDKDMAVLSFQFVVNSLIDINKELIKCPSSSEIFMRNVKYVMLLMEAAEFTISEFDIAWRDCIEATSITACVIDLLRLTVWPSRMIARAMKLVQVSIEKYLPANLALLVEEDGDKTMESLGNLLLAKLCDREPEVRDSALELARAMANISNTKYPSFQTMLMDLDIITLVVTIAMSDSERFVRASALQCLIEMLQVPLFWTDVLVHQQIPEKMMHILRTEPESIVRTQAALLMERIYEFQSFPEEQMNEVYRSMAQVVINDLHWEVKQNALYFWAKVICNHLSQQGFIDGKFPNVTFSKEKKKIVTLTESEVRAAIEKMMLQLSKNGCLAVVLYALHDDCDWQVAEKALYIVKKMFKILKKYNVKSADPTATLPKSPLKRISVDMPFTPPHTPQMDLSDAVIEQILNSNDANLLADVCLPEDQVNLPLDQQYTLTEVTPAMFINYLYENDLDIIVSEKAKWLNKMNDLNTLLNDMLKVYDSHSDVNGMDCY